MGKFQNGTYSSAFSPNAIPLAAVLACTGTGIGRYCVKLAAAAVRAGGRAQSTLSEDESHPVRRSVVDEGDVGDRALHRELHTIELDV